MAVNIHITIIELNALHTKRPNLFHELDAVIHLLMEANHCGLRKSRNATILFFLFKRLPTISTLFPYTTLFRSVSPGSTLPPGNSHSPASCLPSGRWQRSEEHTSELQSRGHLVCRLLLEKKNHHERQKQPYGRQHTYHHYRTQRPTYQKTDSLTS